MPAVERDVGGLHDCLGVLEQLPLEQLFDPPHGLVAEPGAAAAAKVLKLPLSTCTGMHSRQQQRELFIDSYGGDHDSADLRGDRGRRVVRAEVEAAEVEAQCRQVVMGWCHDVGDAPGDA